MIEITKNFITYIKVLSKEFTKEAQSVYYYYLIIWEVMV